MLQPKDSFNFNVADLLSESPIEWSDSNKAFAAKLVSVAPDNLEGDIVFKVWAEIDLPQKITDKCKFVVKETFFDYSSDKQHFDWYLNFADPDLFGYYNSSLMAQDELQVFEHPVLAHLREKLLSIGFYPETTDDSRRPTPVTIKGAYRICSVNTLLDEDGYSIYGNAFSRASKEIIRKRVTPIIPPSKSNILAIASLPSQRGFYTEKQIEDILITAFSGFYAANYESDKPQKPRFNSGFWGCGAYGGNRTIMTILQLVAASLAGVELRYWAGDSSGVAVAEDAYQIYCDILKKTDSTQEIINTLAKMKFDWGVSDGN
jgi:hypothetical protein